MAFPVTGVLSFIVNESKDYLFHFIVLSGLMLVHASSFLSKILMIGALM